MSFADLVTLILGFFVMMYAAKTHDTETWQILKESTFSFFNNKGRLSSSAGETTTEKLNIKRNFTLTYFENNLKNLQSEKPSLQNVFTLERKLSYLDINFNYTTPLSKELLSKLVSLLHGKKNQVEIEACNYRQEESLKISKKIIDFLKISGLNKNIPIKVDQEIFRPETFEVKNKIGMVTVRIYADEE